MLTNVYYPPTQNGLQKTLDASLLTGVTASATLNNVVGVQNKRGIMVIDRVDSNNNLTPNKREYVAFTGTSGSTVVTLTRGLGGSTDQDHAVGAIVEFVNDVVQQKALLTELEAINTAVSALPTASSTTTFTNKDLTSTTNTFADIVYTNSMTRQVIINGGGYDISDTVRQRNPFIAAANVWANHKSYYGCDRWLVYESDATVIDSQNFSEGSIGVYKENNAGTNKSSLMQLIEARNSYPFRGQKLSFGFKIDKTGTTAYDFTVFILAMKAAGTADSIDNAPITNFSADGVRPLFDTTNYTVLYEGDFSNTLVDGNTRVIGTSIAVPSDAKNIIFGVVNKQSFLSSDAFGGFKIKEVQLNAGDVALPFMPKSFDDELRSCMRYYEKSYDYEIAVGTAVNTGGATDYYIGTATTGQMYYMSYYKVEKRVSVSPILYDIAGASGKVYKGANGKTAQINSYGKKCFSGGTADTTSATELIYHWTDDAEL